MELKVLQNAAEDMNRILVLKPPIDITYGCLVEDGVKGKARKEAIAKAEAEGEDALIEKLTALVTEAAELIDPEKTPGDANLSDETVELLGELGLDDAKTAILLAREKLPKDPPVQKGKRGRPAKTEKVEKLAKAEKPPKPPKEPKAPKATSSKKTRTESFIDVVNNLKCQISIDDLAELANNDYVSGGGKDNLKQSKHLVDVMMPCAIGFGKVSKIDPKTVAPV